MKSKKDNLDIAKMDDFDFEEDDFSLLDNGATSDEMIKRRQQKEVSENIGYINEKISSNEQEQEDNDITQNKKSKFKFKSTTNDSEEVIDPTEVELLILTDRYHSNLLRYFRGCGINVKKIYTDLRQLRNAIMFAFDTVRVVIVDTGLGKFTNLAARQEIKDILGLVEDTCRISFFYTDKINLNEAKESLEFNWKDIHWNKYISTASTVASLFKIAKKKNEIYIMDKDDIEDDKLTWESVKKTKGIEVIHKKKSYTTFAKPVYDIDIIQENLYSDKFNKLEEFNIKY